MVIAMAQPAHFFEGMNDRTGQVDFGFGYEVQDNEGPGYAFPWALRKRLPPGPDWQALCHLNPIDVRTAVRRIIQDVLRTKRPKFLVDSAEAGFPGERYA